jgi:predicted XRE-type DNA-binding protein
MSTSASSEKPESRPRSRKGSESHFTPDIMRTVGLISTSIATAAAKAKAAARLMGIDQPKVSAMLAGQFRGYSVERLMRFLVALGHDVEIVVKPRSRGTAELRVA